MAMDGQGDLDMLLDLRHELLHRRRDHHSDGVWDVYPVDADLLDCLVHDVQELKFGPGSVFIAEFDNEAVILSVLYGCHRFVNGLELRDLKLLLKMGLRSGEEYVDRVDVAR